MFKCPINFSKRISKLRSTNAYFVVQICVLNVKSPLHHKMAIWNGQL